MELAEFNAMETADAAAAVRPCVAIDSFVETVVSHRPYADLESLLATAAAHTDEWTDAEVVAALADHPRIGEKPTPRSRREQSGVGEDDDVRRRLREGNRRYEERFGRIYLVRAAGRTGEELLDLLEQRLANDPRTELAVTRAQLGEITLLRLEGLFTP